MTLVRTNHNEMFPTFRNLFDDFFKNDFSDWRMKNYALGDTTLPSVNIKEDEQGYAIEMAAPGMKKDDFNIELKDNTLVISSEKRNEVEDQKDNYTRKEFSYQSFQRAFTLPETADVEKIDAKYKDGILNLSIAKKEEAKPKAPKSIKIS